ncbi:MAG: two-component sensor histidine kinase [Ahrensia sp.]|nr:two-component sensor histidine kinase [Ahrensia sp.]
MARRMVPVARSEAETGDPAVTFLAEKLIALAAGATFIVGPMCLVLSGFGLPGTYGAATAIALAHLAIPFLALGWLSIHRKPWSTGIFTLASWSALAGTLIAVSPLLALTSGLVLFAVAGSHGTARRVESLMAPQKAAPATEPAPEAEREGTRAELTHDGIVKRVRGSFATQIQRDRPFVDHVHLADRIAFLAALADVTGKREARSEITARINLARAGDPQSFEPVRLELTADDGAITLLLRTPQEAPTDAPAEPGIEKQFLATVSHELRTPLNSIIGFSDILRRDIFGPLANERQREYVNLIHSSGAHLLAVVNTILDVSKLNAGTYSIHRDPFDLNAVVRECASMLRPQAEAKEVAVELDLDAAANEADADRRAMKQIAINLLSNAIKFTETGGTIHIGTETRQDGFLLKVRDTGIGMSDDDLRLIGTPFTQVDNAYTRSCEGTGLGLTVVTGLVQLHGGSLDVKSVPGEGTEMTIFIPGAIRHERDALEVGNSNGRQAPGIGRSDANTNTIRLAG